MRKDQLQPWLQNIPWAVPILGVVVFITAPIVAPLAILWVNREQFAEYYAECFEAMRGVDKP